MGKEVKSGMYGEMPKIKIGEYSLCEFSDKKNEKTIWIEHESGEGSQFQKSDFLKVLNKFYKENF